MRWTVLLGLAGLVAGSPLVAASSPSAGSRFAAGAAAGAGSPAAQALIARCAQRASVETRGIDELRATCPGIDRAVEALSLAAFLPAHWRSEASAQALADLSALAARYAGSAPALGLDVPQLRRIALGLAPPPAPASWWQRIGAWIKARLQRWLTPANADARGWLRLLPYLIPGPRFTRILLATLTGLIVLAVVAVVVLEWRTGGLFDRRRRARRIARRSSAVAESDGAELAEGGLDSAFLDTTGQHARPVLLVRFLVQALTASRRIGQERSLSFRELIARARFDSDRQRAVFGCFALRAECALYGGPQLAAAIPESELSDARALHAELLRPPAGAEPAAAAAQSATSQPSAAGQSASHGGMRT